MRSLRAITAPTKTLVVLGRVSVTRQVLATLATSTTAATTLPSASTDTSALCLLQPLPRYHTVVKNIADERPYGQTNTVADEDAQPQ